MMVCVTGMHRSGTSLVASYLHQCGINMGDYLIKGRKGNERGYFEDVQVVDLHNKIIRSNRCHIYYPIKYLAVPLQYLAEAHRFIVKRSALHTTWGWKDPRACLFLPMWNSLHDNIKFVFLYRHPYLVIDSLFRRGDRIFQFMPWLAAKAWMRYNKELLSFYDHNKNNCILINITAINRNPEHVILIA